jgi:hypothetical protein
MEPELPSTGGRIGIATLRSSLTEQAIADWYGSNM